MKTNHNQRNHIFICFFILSIFSSGVVYAQVKELENLRSATYRFVQYDLGKTDSIPKNKQNDARMKSELDVAWMKFVLHKDSKNFDSLKQKSINNKTSYTIGNHNYFIHDLRKNQNNRSLDNNVNHNIIFYGIYDYALPNFVSVFIQPYNVGKQELVIYYFKLNGSGSYYIKDITRNKILFESSAHTSNAPVVLLQAIDDTHCLLVEDMGDNGQRAMVIEKTKIWKPIKAFKGRYFNNTLGPYSSTTEVSSRQFLRCARNRNISSIYGESFLSKYNIQFDEKTKTLFYREYRKNEEEVLRKAIWKNNCFLLDDYYLGQHLNDEPIPFPG